MADAGIVYLLHFARPYVGANGRGKAGHYIGWAADLDGRLRHHRAGTGANLLRVITAAGITWELARTWPGSRALERRLKDRKEAPRLCPLCTPRPRPVRLP